MGLGLLIVVLKTLALRLRKPRSYGDAARFWARIFAVNFAMGVVTGIPMEFQFGTNWARFSNYAGTGRRPDPVHRRRLCLLRSSPSSSACSSSARSALGPWQALARGRRGLRPAPWLSGYFIVATNAWMQHPVGYPSADGRTELTKACGRC